MSLTVVLVCGGRKYRDQAHVFETLDAIRAHYGDLVIIHGCAEGADMLASRWAEARGLHRARVAALWGRYAKGAGPKRNAAMAALRPHLCIAFPGGDGTADMVRQAQEAGIETYEV